MSALLERMERIAVPLGDPALVKRDGTVRGLRYQPITDWDVDSNDRILFGEQIAVDALARAPQGVLDFLAKARDFAGHPSEPRALIGGLAGIESGAEVMLADDAAITGGTVNVALWESRTRTPIPPLSRKGVQYELDAEGTVTSSGAAQTVILNPHVGAGNTVGTNLTASPTQTLGSTITLAIWRAWAQLTVRTVGAGTAATVIGGFRFEYTILANGGAPTTVIWRSSGGAATFDSTVLNGLVMGVTPSAAGVSIVVRQIKWGSWG